MKHLNLMTISKVKMPDMNIGIWANFKLFFVYVLITTILIYIVYGGCGKFVMTDQLQCNKQRVIGL